MEHLQLAIKTALHGTVLARVAWWRNGRASDFRPRGRGFDPRSERSCVTILGKLFTPMCLGAESLRYYMESLNWVLYLYLYCACQRQVMGSIATYSILCLLLRHYGGVVRSAASLRYVRLSVCPMPL